MQTVMTLFPAFPIQSSPSDPRESKQAIDAATKGRQDFLTTSSAFLVPARRRAECCRSVWEAGAEE
jgi:hypothetical protein